MSREGDSLDPLLNASPAAHPEHNGLQYLLDLPLPLNVGGKRFQLGLDSVKHSPKLLQYFSTHALPQFNVPNNDLQAASSDSVMSPPLDNSYGRSADFILNRDCIFIDRDPELFELVANYLRTGEIDLNAGLHRDGFSRSNPSLSYSLLFAQGRNTCHSAASNYSLTLLRKEFDYFEIPWPVRCFFCGNLFDESRNTTSSCFYHPDNHGVVIESAFPTGFSSNIDNMLQPRTCVYTCCWQPTGSPGCSKGAHLAERLAVQASAVCKDMKTSVHQPAKSTMITLENGHNLNAAGVRGIGGFNGHYSNTSGISTSLDKEKSKALLDAFRCLLRLTSQADEEKDFGSYVNWSNDDILVGNSHDCELPLVPSLQCHTQANPGSIIEESQCAAYPLCSTADDAPAPSAYFNQQDEVAPCLSEPFHESHVDSLDESFEPLPVWRITPEEGQQMPLVIEPAATTHSATGKLEVNADVPGSLVRPLWRKRKFRGGQEMYRFGNCDVKPIQDSPSVDFSSELKLGSTYSTPNNFSTARSAGGITGNSLKRSTDITRIESKHNESDTRTTACGSALSFASMGSGESSEGTLKPPGEQRFDNECSYRSDSKLIDDTIVDRNLSILDPSENFASSESSCSHKVDNDRLFKTRMCPLLKHGMCNRSADKCNFAHFLDELRPTQEFYKTQLCAFWLAGYCKAGGRCRHAHGETEIRCKERQHDTKGNCRIMWFQVDNSEVGKGKLAAFLKEALRLRGDGESMEFVRHLAEGEAHKSLAMLIND